MEKKFKLSPMKMPNFIFIEIPVGKQKPEGFVKNPVIPVEDLTRAEAEAYAAEITINFMKHWEKKQK